MNCRGNPVNNSRIGYTCRTNESVHIKYWTRKSRSSAYQGGSFWFHKSIFVFFTPLGHRGRHYDAARRSHMMIRYRISRHNAPSGTRIVQLSNMTPLVAGERHIPTGRPVVIRWIQESGVRTDAIFVWRFDGWFHLVMCYVGELKPGIVPLHLNYLPKPDLHCVKR